MAALELLRCGKDLEGRGEVDKAEEMYRLALAADPEHAGWPFSQQRMGRNSTFLAAILQMSHR